MASDPNFDSSPPHLPAAATAELQLRAADILERMADAFVALDGQWRIVYANREACRINRKPLEAFQGKLHWDEWPGALGTGMERQFRRVMAERAEAHFEHRSVVNPGVWLEIDAYPAADGINLFYRDVSERRRAEEALRESEARFRQMADAIPHIAWTAGPDGAVDYYNHRWYDYSGLTLEDTQGWGWANVIHPDDLEHAGGVWRAAVAAGTVSEVEYRLRRADGEHRWHLGRSVPVREGDVIVGWVGTATDIEDRRRAEETQRESETRFRALADNIAQLAWMADGSGGLFWYNQRWFDYTGTTLEEMQGWGWKTVHHPDYLGPVIERWREHLTEGRVWEDTFPLRGTDGKYRWFLSRAAPIRDEAGSVMLWCGTNTDITEQREAAGREQEAATRQQAFLRDVLASVTEGRLLLSNSPAQLPPPLTSVGEPIRITREAGLRELRQRAQEAARVAGHAEERRHDLVTAASEAGMNAVMHGGGTGTAWVGVSEDGMVQVRVEDHGTGIAMENLPRATLARGFSTKATLGHGLKMMLETADRLSLLTGPAGTTVVLEQEREKPLPAWL